MGKRIKDLTAGTLTNADFFPIDGASGTKKLSTAIITGINDAIDAVNADITGLQSQFAPAYDSSTTYNKGQFCSYNKKFYKCNTDGTTGAWDASKWTGVSVSTVVASLNSELDKLAHDLSLEYNQATTYGVNDFCVKDRVFYRCNTEGTTGTWDSSKWTQVTAGAELKDLIENKATKVSVKGLGNAIGMRGWNQLAHGDFASTDGWQLKRSDDVFSVSGGEATFTRVTTGAHCVLFSTAQVTYNSSHKYYMKADVKNVTSSSQYIHIGFLESNGEIGGNSYSSLNKTAYTTIEHIASPTNSTDIFAFRIGNSESTETNVTYNIKNAMLIDLTEIFGVGNEPTTVDALHEMLSASYYPYYKKTVYNNEVLGNPSITNVLTYSGISFSIPKNNLYSVRLMQQYSHTEPKQTIISKNIDPTVEYAYMAEGVGHANLVGATEADSTFYIHLKSASSTAKTNPIKLFGYVESI